MNQVGASFEDNISDDYAMILVFHNRSESVPLLMGVTFLQVQHRKPLIVEIIHNKKPQCSEGNVIKNDETEAAARR